MSNRRRLKAPFCHNCKAKRAEHVVVVPDDMAPFVEAEFVTIYSCADCWPALAFVLQQFAREWSDLISFCGCGDVGCRSLSLVGQAGSHG
jgi:hypothetical protein